MNEWNEAFGTELQNLTCEVIEISRSSCGEHLRAQRRQEQKD